MGLGFSKTRSTTQHKVGQREGGSVIDKLTEAQLDEFREAFNSFDKVRPCRAHCSVRLGHEDGHRVTLLPRPLLTVPDPYLRMVAAASTRGNSRT